MTQRDLARAASLALAWAVLVVLAARLAPAWPEDWDGVGFLLAVRDFSLERLTPHPPGYPVYVAALRLVASLGASPQLAAEVVAVTSGLGVAALVMRVAASRDSRSAAARSALLIAAATVATPLALRSFTVVGTEGLATLFVVLAVFGLSMRNTRNGALLAGVAVGLGLGVRLSWAPLYLGLLFVAASRGGVASIGGATVAILAWLVPLLLVTGPSRLVALFATHLGGHATRWGGTALTEPSRLRYLARDVFVDGLGIDADPLGIAIGLVVLLLGARTAVVLWARRAARGPRLRGAALAVVAYAAWIAVGQNLREEPRHALPIVIALAVALVLAGFACSTSGAPSRAWTFCAWAFVALTSLRAVGDAHARRVAPPAAAELVLLTAKEPRTLVFGARSARFFQLDPRTASRGRTAATLGDVVLALGRERVLPARVLVTDELEGRASSPYPLVRVVNLCRPERLDRRRPCLEVDELRAPFLLHGEW